MVFCPLLYPLQLWRGQEKKEYFQKSPKKARVIDDKTTPVLQGPEESIKPPRGEFLLTDPMRV